MPGGASQARYIRLSKYIPAKQLLRIVRSHWGIENQLHWVLDVVFNEDRNRTRKDNAPENLAILRKLALNLVRSHPAATSLRQKIKRAGWDDASSWACSVICDSPASWGRAGGGGRSSRRELASANLRPPPPSPPHKGGGELHRARCKDHTERAATSRVSHSG